MAHVALSPSRARDFEECPWKYREVRVRKAPVLPADPLDFGSLIHGAIEEYVKHLMATKQEMNPAEAPAVWAAFVAARPKPVPQRMYTEALDLLVKFAGGFRLDLDRVWKPEANLAVDAERQPVDFFAPSVRVRGKCDLVLTDGIDAWVDDWKSARFVLRDDDIKTDLQAQTYAVLVLSLLTDLHAVTVRFRYIRYGYIASATFTRHEADAIWARWQEIGARIDAAHGRLDDEKLWAPTPGWHCQTCPVVVRCPAGMLDKAMTLALPLTAEQAQEAAGRVLVLDAEAKALKEGLRGYVDGAGPVTVGGMTFNAYKEESYEYDTNRVIGLAKKHFIEPSTVLKVDTDALKRMAKKEKPFFADVVAERTDKCRLVFKSKKAQPEHEAPAAPEADAGSQGAAATPGDGNAA